MLSKLKELIQEIASDNTVARYKELEKLIDSDEKLMNEYKKLLDLQKIMVQDEAKNSSRLSDSKTNYELQYNMVMEHYLMAEYLDIVEVVNNDLQLIKNIILHELSADFE
jgi:cell fate (sporulation/competence/biofilm development) regulator YmcA (YheA/YmcA/DUF963 family)